MAIELIDKIKQKNGGTFKLMDAEDIAFGEHSLTEEIDSVKTQLSKNKNSINSIQTQVNSVASGSPKGVYASVSALTSAFPNGNNNIYVVSSDGGWYYWSGSAWTKGGVYQSTGVGEGTVSLNNLNASMQTQANKLFSSVFVPGTHNTTTDLISLDTTAKTITINESAPSAHVLHSLRTSENVGYLPTQTLSYAGFTSTALTLCLDVVNQQYVLREYGKAIGENEVMIAGIRTNGNSDSYLVTVDGKPNPLMQNILNKGTLKNRYATKTLFSIDNERYNKTPLFVWDVENKKVTIPKAEFMYGSTPIQVEKAYDISYDDGSTSLYALCYNEDTKLFEVLAHSQFNTKRGKYLLYDLVRINNSIRKGLLTDSIVFVDSEPNIKYIKLEELFDYTGGGITFFPGGNYTSHVVGNHTIIKAGNVLNNTSNSRFGIRQKDNSKLASDCAKITAKDKVSKCTLKIKNPKLNIGLHVYAYKEDGSFERVVDSGWKNPTNALYTLDVDTLTTKYGTIYLTGFFRFEDDASHHMDELENPEIEFNVTYKHQEEEEELEYTQLDLDTVRVYQNKNRTYLDIDVPFTALDSFYLKVENTRVEYNGVTYNLKFSLHGFNKNGSWIYDSNYQKVPFQHNAIIGHPNSHPGTMELPVIISELAYVKIYVAYDNNSSVNQFPNEDDPKNILRMANLSYAVRGFRASDLDQMDKDTIFEQVVVDAYVKSNGENSSFVVEGEVILDGTNKLEYDTITIPVGCRSYEVEFTAKVTGGEGHLQFTNFYNKFSITNTNYRTFKFRITKSHLTSESVVITPTVPSGEQLYIKNIKVVPINETTPMKDHNYGSFYTHRGLSYIYPENTLMALIEACERGSSMVELDLFTSADGKALILHDNNLGRTNKARPTITLKNPGVCSVDAGSLNTLLVNDTETLKEFEVHDDVSVTINGTEYARRVTSVNRSTKKVVFNGNFVAGVATKVVNNRRNVATCTEAEFLQYEVGEYKNVAFKGEMTPKFDDFIKIARQYGTSVLMDIRTMTEQCFKNHIAKVLDRYDYWEHIYFMHGQEHFTKYNNWANDINRNIQVVKISWDGGDILRNEITDLANASWSNISTKDIACECSNLTEELVAYAHDNGLRVIAFTVNKLHNTTGAMALFRMGVDIVGTDIYTDDRCLMW
jgi:glycerophosphoryl diester phosphodiesterase